MAKKAWAPRSTGDLVADVRGWDEGTMTRRFLRHVEFGEHPEGWKTPCWHWTGGVRTNRPWTIPICYIGKPADNPRSQRHAHAVRVAWARWREEALPPHVVSACGNPYCVNPTHLVGTDTKAGRGGSGQSWRGSKRRLTDEQVAEVRGLLAERSATKAAIKRLQRLVKERLTLQAIGSKYGLTREAVRLIEAGVLYKEPQDSRESGDEQED